MSLHGEYPKKQTFYKQLVAVLAEPGVQAWCRGTTSATKGDTIDAPLGYANPASLKQALMWRAEGYARHRQEGQACHIMVACEAAGMVPQLSRICHDYGVTVRSSGGMDSVTVKRNLGVEIATRIVECQQPTILLHIGDWDPTGISIYTQIYHDVGAFISGHLRERYDIQMPYGYYRAERIALTQEHVDAMDPSLLGKVKKRKKREYDEDTKRTNPSGTLASTATRVEPARSKRCRRPNSAISSSIKSEAGSTLSCADMSSISRPRNAIASNARSASSVSVAMAARRASHRNWHGR